MLVPLADLVECGPAHHHRIESASTHHWGSLNRHKLVTYAVGVLATALNVLVERLHNRELPNTNALHLRHTLVHDLNERRMELFVEDANIHYVIESRIGNAQLLLHLNPERQFHDAGKHARFI